MSAANLIDSFKADLEAIESSLLSVIEPGLPASLRDPIHYFLKLPGKKIRPLLALCASRAVGGSVEAALPAAVAVELFHDFTLIHDDIMDQDELRRGFAAMHVKYGDSTAILVGDAMIGLSFQELMKISAPVLEPVVKQFSEALVRVCEGQALDKEFENRDAVTVDEYLEMIGKKTAWLLQASCAMGAMCGGGTPDQVDQLARFGYNLGLGFQIQDDLLDFVADQAKLGKKVGSDFEMHKKTYVTLKYREMVENDPDLGARYPHDLGGFPDFAAFQTAIHEMGVVDAVREVVQHYHDQTLDALAAVTPLSDDNPLYRITRFLQSRQY